MEGLNLGASLEAFTCTRNSSQTSGWAWAQPFIRRFHSSLVSLYCSKLWQMSELVPRCYMDALSKCWHCQRLICDSGHDLLNLGMLKFAFLKWAIMIGLLWALGASLIAQSINHLPAVQETWVWVLGQEDPLEKEMATHSNILAWRITSAEESGGLQSMGSQELDTT